VFFALPLFTVVGRRAAFATHNLYHRCCNKIAERVTHHDGTEVVQKASGEGGLDDEEEPNGHVSRANLAQLPRSPSSKFIRKANSVHGDTGHPPGSVVRRGSLAKLVS
jgi:hypothetical protein